MATGKKGRQTEKPPSIDKLLKPAIGVGLALLGWQFYKGLSRDILRVDVANEFEMQELLYSDTKNYAVLCHNDDASKLPISSVFQDSSADGKAPVQYRIMDCQTPWMDKTLPDTTTTTTTTPTTTATMTFAKRFKLDLTKRPTIFVSGQNGEPKQVPQKHLKTGSMLTKTLQNLLETRSTTIGTTQDLRVKCLNQPYCALLLKGTKTVDTATKKAYQTLMNEFPKVTFAAIDTTNLYVSQLEAELDDLVEGQHRFVMFQKISGGLGTNDARLITSFVAQPGRIHSATMSKFVKAVLDGTTPTQKLAALPMIKTRSKKLVQEEKAKKQRKAEPKSIPTSSTSTANDGTKDGRRLERDKRREEHRATTGAKERTPEELQEMERRRRIRMEEEAAKWNIAPDDAPDEGEHMNEDTTMWNDQDEGDESKEQKDSSDTSGSSGHAGSDNDDDDDEDVMDLD
jgi:hypothetical protein